MFKFTRNHLYSLGFVTVFAFNPGACARMGKGCGAASKADDLARYSKMAESDVLIASREVAESGFYRTKIQQTAVDAGMDAEKANELSRSTVVRTQTGQYEYNGQVYKNIDAIALPLNEGKAYINTSVDFGEAIRFLLHGHHLLHHSETYSEKSEQDYNLIVLMPKDVEKVRELYGCSVDTAQALVDVVYSTAPSPHFVRVNTFKKLTTQVEKANKKKQEAIVILPKDLSARFNLSATLLTAALNKPKIPFIGDLFNQLALFQAATHATGAKNWDAFFVLFSKEYTQKLHETDGEKHILCINPGQSGSTINPRVFGYKRAS